MMDEPDEMLDLVDVNDKVIGTIGRREFQKVIKNPPGNIRAAEAFIVNRRGQIWTPRRTTDKVLAPGGLDFSAAEHVGQGESYLHAIIRGFQEELRMTIQASDLEPQGVLPPWPDFPVFRAIYILRSDDTPDYNPEDFTDYEWLSPAEVLSRLANGDTSKRNLAPTIKEIFNL